MLYTSEIFASIQGEGIRIGVPSIFCRFQGCSFGCPHCDTKYTWKFKDGSKMNSGEAFFADDLARRIAYLAESSSCFDLVLTGGEPTEQSEDQMVMLLDLIPDFVNVITLETAGFVTPIPSGLLRKVDLLSLSPKLSHFHKNSEGSESYRAAVRQYIDFAIGRAQLLTLKFVLTHFDELEEIPLLLTEVSDFNLIRIVLQPNGYEGNKPVEQDDMLECLGSIVQSLQKPNPLTPLQQRGATIQILPQLHRLIWGVKRGV